jgi:diaminohydroxyphosphoribosylaminopyrimidine deaminase/5-amino-6-(5-phosphoribosylamino)uracil reductase
MTEAAFMERALVLARRGLGRTAPNPAVGCVLVREGHIIGEGWHQKAGGPHAEVHAIADAGDAAGATAYVTLEPCNFTGRTGPCTEALIAAGVTRVVAASLDPNPKVAGGGLKRLEATGIETHFGLCGPAGDRLIGPFRHWILNKRPEVTLKVATSLDGRIATSTGHSQWVTGKTARLDGHRLRDQLDAIMVGSGTVIADNPRLTTRLPKGGRNPRRIVVSASLAMPLKSALFTPPLATRTIVVTTALSDPIRSAKARALRDCGVEILEVRGDRSVDLSDALTQLADLSITSVLVEGGRGLLTSLLNARLCDRMVCYVAPCIVGDDGLGWAGPLGIRSMNRSIRLANVESRTLGTDIRIEGDCVYGNH